MIEEARAMNNAVFAHAAAAGRARNDAPAPPSWARGT